MNTQGTVKWFNDAKGYGYIDTDTEKNIFAHYTAIQMDGFRTIAEGDTVTFDLIQGAKGAQAFNIVKVDV